MLKFRQFIILFVTLCLITISLLRFNADNNEHINMRLIYSGDDNSVFTNSDFINPKFLDPNNQTTINQIIKNNIGVVDGDDEFIRTVKISRYILTKTAGLPGDPPMFDESNYFDFWKKIEERQVAVACREFSNMYALFANNAGIPTRTVSVRNQQENGKFLEHAVAESYSQKNNKWYMVDLMYKQAYVLDEKNNPLETFEYATRINAKQTQGIRINNAYTVYGYGSNSDRNYENRLRKQTKYYNGKTTLTYGVYKSIRMLQ